MLILFLILLLISNAVTLRRDKSILYSRVVIKSLLLISFIAYNNLYIAPLSKGIALYGGLLNVTTFTQTFNIFILLVSAAILTLTAFYPRKVAVKAHSSVYSLFFKKLVYNKTAISNKTEEQFRIIEYPLIIVFIICGALFFISTSDLISIFLSIELQSYGLYILSTLYRDSESSTASGLTYFLLGGVSSCFILLGSALLYANTGTTNLENIYVITSISEIKDVSSLAYLYQPYYFHLSLIIMCVGFLFKVSAPPFHFWSPDVYDDIPTIVTSYVAIIAKITIFAFLLELVYYTEYNFFDLNYKSIFAYTSLFSLIICSVLGLIQGYRTIYFFFFTLVRLNNIRFAILNYAGSPIMCTLTPLHEYCAGLGISFTALLIGIEALVEVHNTWAVPRYNEFGVQQDMITIFNRVPMDVRHTFASHVLNRVDNMVVENPLYWTVENPMNPSRMRIIPEGSNRIMLNRIIDDSTIEHHINLSSPWMREFFRLRFEVHRHTINKEGGFIWEE